nr:hypothetical protein CFP56_25662 [Quercus suber]
MCIKEPWSKALIVKVFGRTVGFNYLTFKINALWKPAARMDFVNLEKDFFLKKIRFNSFEDYDMVLCGGPWFVGEHFLTIRHWEPYFKASEAKLSSVAVWVRLPELPIEFYDREVLKKIGEAIGLVTKSDPNKESSKGRLGNHFANLYVVEDKSTHEPRRVDPDDTQHGPMLTELTHHSPGEEKFELENEMALCQGTLGRDSVANMKDYRGKATHPTKSRTTKGLGIKSSKSLKRQNSSSGANSIQGELSFTFGSSSIRTNENKFQKFELEFVARLGNEVQGQGDSSARRSNSPDQSYSNGHHGQDGVPGPGSPNLGHHTQSVVEISHGCSSNISGRGGKVEQATKAISGSSLRQIRMVNSGKESNGLPGVGIGTHGKSSNPEAGSDLSTDSELRSTDMLQGGHPWNPLVLDDMETGLDNGQGPITEDGLEHGGSSHLES